MALEYDTLASWLDTAAGVRARIPLEPLGGPGVKIAPPTFGVDDGAESRYALETRAARDGEGRSRNEIDSVVLDTIAAQAHEFSGALQEAIEDGSLELPRVGTDFRDVPDLAEFGLITDLDAPHRVFDAILRDSLDGDVPFRFGAVGRAVTEATLRNATSLYVHSPSALIFGAWDSTGPKGGRGSKFERALTSEIVASDITVGVGTSSRIDPLGIEIKGTTVYRAEDGGWTLEEAEARRDKGKAVTIKPSEINHGNVRPSLDRMAGGVRAGSITATTVLSLIQLRRLRFVFDADGRAYEPEQRARVERAARTTLASVALCAAALAFEAGFDLRSRCVLAPTSDLMFETVGRAGSVEAFSLTGKEALSLVSTAAERTGEAGLRWRDGLLTLRPTDRLCDLVRRSKAAATGATVAASTA